MLFAELMESCLDKSLEKDVNKLLDLKMTSPEISEGKRFNNVNEYIEKSLQAYFKKR